jgi:nitroimidazol reductase NimA-like FMN-containing flavoprotein (pyridoxamine 5'-phosphate oxidase superfamily)
MSIGNEQILRRLRSAPNLWVATVRPDGRPHLTPTWFVVHDEKVYICIDPASVKARNLARNRHVALALEDGSAPIIVEGSARRLERADWPPAVIDSFQRKYEWNIAGESQYSLLIEIAPAKVLSWGASE